MPSSKEKSLAQSVVTALDGSDNGLFPYLPYLLQDVWEMGSDPRVMIDLVRRHARARSRFTVLDLGCGKGAVSVQLVKALGCSCLGIDAVEEFIAEAKRKAKEHGVDGRCRFETGDIRERVATLAGFDVIILGSIGPVFGDYYQTLTAVTPCLGENGTIIIDDGYIEDDCAYTHPRAQKRTDMLRQVADAGMRIIEEVITEKTQIKEADEYILNHMKQRCRELSSQHSDKKALFETYLAQQEKEGDALLSKIVCAALVIQKYQ